MKKLLFLTTVALAALMATATLGFAQSGAGAFGYAIELTTGGTSTLYELSDSGDGDLVPSGFSGTISGAWSGASSDATHSFNLGTFNVGGTLTLNGGSLLAYVYGGDSYTGTATLMYGVTPSSTLPSGTTDTMSYSLPGEASGLGGSGNNTRFATTGGTVNLLSGLAPGTYYLSTYGFAQTNIGNQYQGNGGNNFAATFTVVPEPGTWALMFGGLGLLVILQRSRRIRG